MIRFFACAILGLSALACGDSGQRFGLEPNMDADLRVIVTASTRGERAVVSLTRDEPFHLPLAGLLEGDERIRVVVVAYGADGLREAYPALANLDVPVILAELRPEFGMPAAGAYLPPKPLRAIETVLDASSPSMVRYAEIDFEEIEADPTVSFVFRVSAERACPPGVGPLRVFARDDVGIACSFDRREDCTWTREQACPEISTILGLEPSESPALRETPSALVVEGTALRCPRITATGELSTGETSAFSCGTAATPPRIVAIQERPLKPNGEPWAPKRQSTPLELPARKTSFTRTLGGLVFAAESRPSNLELTRIQVGTSGMTELGPLVWRPSGGEDPTNIILSSTSRGALALSSSPSGDLLVVDAETEAFVLESAPLATANENASAYYLNVRARQGSGRESETYPAPSLAIGPLVAGANGNLYWPVRTGLVRYSKSATARTGAITHDDVPGAEVVRLHALYSRVGAVDRILTWSDQGDVWVYDPVRFELIGSCHERWDILSAFAGPKLVTSREPFVLEIIDLAKLEDGVACRALSREPLVIPPLGTTTGRLSLDEASALVVADHRAMLVVRGSSFGGVVDLETGYSQLVAVESPTSASIFLDVQRRTWGVFTTESGVAPAYELPDTVPFVR